MLRARPNNQMQRFVFPYRAFPTACFAMALTLGIQVAEASAQDGPPQGPPPNGQQSGGPPSFPPQGPPRPENRSGQQNGQPAGPRPPMQQPPAPSPSSPQASTLPATQPTALGNATAPIAASAPPTTAAKRAEVTFENGLLDVKADDSSLNQILHLISRRTGMTITGGVSDQRIFGDYGPASPSTVLATLLDGTGVNMILHENESNTPVELVLSQRNGGPTPPSPNQGNYDDSAETPPAQPASHSASPSPAAATMPAPAANSTPAQPVSSAPLNNPLGSPSNSSPTASTLNTTNSVPLDTLPSPTTATQPAPGIVDAPNPPPAGSTSDANGTVNATPEQIYQQLLKLQQQKNSTTTTPPQ